MNIKKYSDTGETVKPQLVFLVGTPRSGTTWLQKLLGNHPDIGTAQESHLFNHFLGSMLHSWDHLLQFKDGRGGIGIPAYQTEAAFLAMLNEQAHEVLSGADEYRKGSVFLEKTPDHIRHMKDILRVVPDARIVLMVRRPADVIESMLSAGEGWGKHWAPGSIVQAIRLFRYFSGKAESDLRDLDTTRVMCVEYERLRESTADVLQGILEFLELPCDAAIVDKLRNDEFILRRYGEFARLGGHVVQEPDGFARGRKGNLKWWERLLVRLTLGNRALIRNTEVLDGNRHAMPGSNCLKTFTARQVFDRSSAVVLLVVSLPLIILFAIRARFTVGRVFDREPVLGAHGHPVELRRFAGFHAGRNFALLTNIALGHIAWVGTKPIRQTGSQATDVSSAPCSEQRPGLICRQRLQKLTGTFYELDNAPATVVSDEAEMSLIASLSLMSRYFVARLMAPDYAARQPSRLRMLGVNIDNLSIEGALDLIAQRVESRTSSMLSFVNPDCLNKAVRDPVYAKNLESMDAVFADGIGLQIGCRMLGYQLRANVNGTDLFPLICDQATRLNHAIYLLGGQAGVAQKTAERMQKQFPQLRIAGTQHGFFKAEETADIKSAINASGADILLVAFGAPSQEAWLAEHLESLDVSVGLGVGGLFDFYSGRISRSPRWLRDIGMEWSWRLLQEPGRMWRRYILGNALFLFHIWRQTKQDSGKRIVQRFSGNYLDQYRARLSATLSHALHSALLLFAMAARRLLDVVVAGGAILALSPLLIGVAICIKLESPGPVIFSQRRVGKWGEYFTMYKFRSMCVNADEMKQGLASENQMDGGVLFKVKSDPRMTRTGRFIRKYSIDELPQLWNVLKGDMALVGPRPPVKSEVDQYCMSDRRRLEIKPGITCLWQVSGRSEIPFKEQVELDVEYIESHGIWQDFKILLRTVPAVFLGKGAY